MALNPYLKKGKHKIVKYEIKNVVRNFSNILKNQLINRIHKSSKFLLTFFFLFAASVIAVSNTFVTLISSREDVSM